MLCFSTWAALCMSHTSSMDLLRLTYASFTTRPRATITTCIATIGSSGKMFTLQPYAIG
jgi:hypothetical protein